MTETQSGNGTTTEDDDEFKKAAKALFKDHPDEMKAVAEAISVLDGMLRSFDVAWSGLVLQGIIWNFCQDNPEFYTRIIENLKFFKAKSSN